MRRAPADQAVRELAATAIDRSIFLDAGAGCGKTQALTDRYLNLLESGMAVREIVAVTFTNKAARDMKARLRERCEERAKAAEDPAAATRWRKRARELESAPISTIHSFCTNLLRRHAMRAELDPQFALMDEIQQRLVLAEAVRGSLLTRLEADQEAASLLVSQLGLNDAIGAITKAIESREEIWRDLQTPPTTQQLLAQWQQSHEQTMAARAALLPQSRKWKAAVQTLLENPADDPGHAVDLQRLEVLECALTAQSSEASSEERIAALRQLLAVGATSRARGGWDDPDRRKLVTDAMACLKNASEDIGKRLTELLRPWEDCEEASQSSAALTSAVYQEAAQALAVFTEKKERGSKLDFEDVQILARDLLRDNAAVRQECHERYRQMLVDEFQDTNALQKDLLWLAAGAEPGQPPPPGRLFVVGDAKQSNYRFRDADVSVFDQTRLEFEETPGHERLRLEVTFRAHPEVAKLHNDLFMTKALMGPDTSGRQGYEAFYEPLLPHRQTEAVGLASDLLIVAPEEDAGDEMKAEELRRYEGLAIAEWIKRAIGTLTVYDKDGDGEKARPAKPGDFALLFRSTTNLRLYERALRLHGLKYYVSAGRGFFTRQEILDLMNLLRALENRRDEIALAGALRSPLFALSDETLYWLKAQGDNLQEALDAAAAGEHAEQRNIQPHEVKLVEFASAELEALRQLKNRLPISALIGEALDRTGYTAAVATLFGGEQMLSNLRRLIDLARGFEGVGNYSLRDFIDYLKGLVVSEERMGQAPVEEESGESIKLMTIHAAKGLEWPIVIVPDLGRGDQGNSDKNGWRYHRRLGVIAAPRAADKRQWPALGQLIKDLDEAEERAERRRLLYVAATRCRDHLVLSSALGLQRGADSWLEWLTEATELDTQAGLARMEGIKVHRYEVNAMQEPPPPAVAAALGRQLPSAEELRRRMDPVQPSEPQRRRLTVTGLATYLDCPTCYRLKYLEGMPDARVSIPLSEAGQTLSALERGTLVHQTLEIVGSRGVEAIEEALQVAQKLRTTSPAERERISAMVQWYLESDLYLRQVKPSERLRSEMPLLFELEGALLEGKLDAVAEHEGGKTLDVLDYKTGYEDQDTGQAGHRFQLGLYCAGLQLLGKQVRSANIVYLDARKLVELTAEDVAAAREQAVAAIRAIGNGEFAKGKEAKCEGCGVGWACLERPTARVENDRH
jgi:ATP-dependent helicase/nuclease subunit A